jgi:transposase
MLLSAAVIYLDGEPVWRHVGQVRLTMRAASDAWLADYVARNWPGIGEAVGVIGGVRQKIHFLCMDLPQSDACFVKAYPRETTEAFLDGHVSAFAFFGGVPLSILYDNTTIAVARVAEDQGEALRHAGKPRGVAGLHGCVTVEDHGGHLDQA